MQKLILSVTFFLFSFGLIAQKSVKDSVINIPMFYGNYGLNLTGGDYAKRFGPNTEIGGGLFT
jgi:hypothetical protein